MGLTRPCWMASLRALAVPTSGKLWPPPQLTRAVRPALIACEATDSTATLVLPLTLPAVALRVGVPSALRVTVAEAVPLLHVSVAGVTATVWLSLLLQVTAPL